MHLQWQASNCGQSTPEPTQSTTILGIGALKTEYCDLLSEMFQQYDRSISVCIKAPCLLNQTIRPSNCVQSSAAGDPSNQVMPHGAMSSCHLTPFRLVKIQYFRVSKAGSPITNSSTRRWSCFTHLIIYAKSMQIFVPGPHHSEELFTTAVFGIVNCYFHYVPIHLFP